MDKKKLLEDLEKNIKEYKKIDDKRSMLLVALYQKTIDEIKSKKIKEVKDYLANQISFYGQNFSNYDIEINKIIIEYSKQIEKLIRAYDYLYISTYKKLEQAINNQIVTIGDIVVLLDKRDKETNGDNEKIGNNIISLVQKKVNYSVIIEECKARLEWCINNLENDINEIFQNNFCQLETINNSFWAKLKRKIENLIYGNNKCDLALKKYSSEDLKHIQNNNEIKTINIIALTKGIIRQLKNVEYQINSQYKKSMNI